MDDRDTALRLLNDLALGKLELEDVSPYMPVGSEACLSLALMLSELRQDLAWAYDAEDQQEATRLKRRIELGEDVLLKRWEEASRAT